MRNKLLLLLAVTLLAAGSANCAETDKANTTDGRHREFYGPNDRIERRGEQIPRQDGTQTADRERPRYDHDRDGRDGVKFPDSTSNKGKGQDNVNRTITTPTGQEVSVKSNPAQTKVKIKKNKSNGKGKGQDNINKNITTPLGKDVSVKSNPAQTQIKIKK